ncbi:hypothetical protein UVI_02041730 [Ustilaginoidea virens]|uniref:Uncharacterized protein n=1 Tax=Ustilaginoidea virens TaxID=1159556 RepID=A0A1B5L7J1_USTVR|nr:hypothetical protein UVI_02041730 [Ustilaginoidea virens]
MQEPASPDSLLPANNIRIAPATSNVGMLKVRQADQAEIPSDWSVLFQPGAKYSVKEEGTDGCVLEHSMFTVPTAPWA